MKWNRKYYTVSHVERISLTYENFVSVECWLHVFAYVCMKVCICVFMSTGLG